VARLQFVLPKPQLIGPRRGLFGRFRRARFSAHGHNPLVAAAHDNLTWINRDGIARPSDAQLISSAANRCGFASLYLQRWDAASIGNEFQRDVVDFRFHDQFAFASLQDDRHASKPAQHSRQQDQGHDT
jgi:hypothetical protein